MADRIQLNNQLASMLTAIVDIPQHLQANQAMVDYVDAQDATKSGTGHTHGLFTLSDVTQAQPFSNRHFLFYNAGDGKWKNGWLNDGDIPNINMSKVATGSLDWSRISGSPVTLTGYGINNLTLPSLSGSTVGYIMANENGNLIRVDNPLKAYSESDWGGGAYAVVIDSGDGSSSGQIRSRVFVDPDGGATLQSDAPDDSYQGRVGVLGYNVNLTSSSGVTSSVIDMTESSILIASNKIKIEGPTFVNGSSSSRVIVGSNTDDGSNKLQVSGNTKFTGAVTQSGGIVYLNSSGINRTVIGSSTDDGSNRLQVSGNTKFNGIVTQSGANVILNSTGLNRTLIGTTTDDGSSRLQVSGNVSVGGNINLTGTITTTSTISTGLGGNTGSERFGAGATAGTSSTAVGSGANATSSSATSVGCSTQATTYGTAMGHISKAMGSQSISIGYDSQANNVDSITIGSRGRVSSQGCIGIGNWVQIPASLTNAIVIGIGDSGSTGNYATAIHNNTIVMGYKATSTAANQFMIGTATTNYNMYLNGGLTFTNCPEYVDNAAAIAAGLAIGRVYRTGDLMKIVH